MNATAQAIDETLHALLGTDHHSDIQASVLRIQHLNFLGPFEYTSNHGHGHQS
jgi:hypothetical protein